MANTAEEAQIWIDSLKENNPDYYKVRLAYYRKKMRDHISVHDNDTLSILHKSSLKTLERLKDKQVGLVILDECHHLQGHWGRVMAAINELLADPIVLGLTATPPDPEKAGPKDVSRYIACFGPVDYQVPVPVVLKDGFLAPYQDLAYLVRPLADELEFIADASKALDDLVDELCNPPLGMDDQLERESMIDFTLRMIRTRDFVMGKAGSWEEFEERARKFAISARLSLIDQEVLLPEEVPVLMLDGRRGTLLGGSTAPRRPRALVVLPACPAALGEIEGPRLGRQGHQPAAVAGHANHGNGLDGLCLAGVARPRLFARQGAGAHSHSQWRNKNTWATPSARWCFVISRNPPS